MAQRVVVIQTREYPNNKLINSIPHNTPYSHESFGNDRKTTHVNIWKKLQNDRNHDNFLIVEDDVDLSLKDLQLDSDIIDQNDIVYIKNPDGRESLSSCYIISKNAINRMLEGGHNEIIKTHTHEHIKESISMSSITDMFQDGATILVYAALFLVSLIIFLKYYKLARRELRSL